MKKTTATQKKKTSNGTGDIWKLYPVKSNRNIVRLPILSGDLDEEISITFDKRKSIYSISELETSSTGLVSGTCLLNLDGYPAYTINLTYSELCRILFA